VLSTPIPKDLCPVHREHFRDWRDNGYNPRHPTEWPGGSHILDSRTSHDARETDWDRKNLQQMELVARICRSGRSPQCPAADTIPTT
jgi:hypothetical protein